MTMAEPAVTLEQGRHGMRLMFECRNCTTPLALSPDRFSVRIGVRGGGASASPQWYCPECGVRGDVRNGRIRILGRISLPPSGALAAITQPAARRDAVRMQDSGREVAPTRAEMEHPEPAHQTLPSRTPNVDDVDTSADPIVQPDDGDQYPQSVEPASTRDGEPCQRCVDQIERTGERCYIHRRD